VDQSFLSSPNSDGLSGTFLAALQTRNAFFGATIVDAEFLAPLSRFHRTHFVAGAAIDTVGTPFREDNSEPVEKRQAGP